MLGKYNFLYQIFSVGTMFPNIFKFGRTANNQRKMSQWRIAKKHNLNEIETTNILKGSKKRLAAIHRK